MIPQVREEYEKLLRKYDEDDTKDSRETEERLTASFQGKGFAYKKEIEELLTWKFQTYKARLKTQLKNIEDVPEEEPPII